MVAAEWCGLAHDWPECLGLSTTNVEDVIVYNNRLYSCL